MADEEKKISKEQVNNEISAEFSEIDSFLEKGEEDIQETEEAVEAEIEKEEEIVEELEEKKEDIEERKKEIDEKIRQEKKKVEKLKKEEKELKESEKKIEEIKKDIKENGAGISESVKKVKQFFKAKSRGSSERPWYQNIYEDHYKKLLIIPFLMLFFAVIQIGYQYSATGDFVNRGVDLKGGITLTIPEKAYDISEFEIILNEALQGDVAVRRLSQTKGILIEASDISEEDLLAAVQDVLGELDPETDYSIEQMGSSLGSSFFREIVKAIAIAFILMGIVVFVTFRVPAPSLAVILAAFSDIIITLAIFNMTGAKLGKGGIAAFLMLIGYSVDTDILLSTKVLKRTFGSVMTRVYSAMKTGLTMNITTMVAITVALIFTQSDIIRQIMTILLIGLCVDIINTWIQNVGVLRLYLERKGRLK